MIGKKLCSFALMITLLVTVAHADQKSASTPKNLKQPKRYKRTQAPSPKSNANNLKPANASKANRAALLLRWIDARGNVYRSASASKMQWVWSRASTFTKIDSPALRIEIISRLPSDWSAVKTTADNITIVDPLRQRGGGKQSVTVDLRASSGTMRIKFVDQKKNEIEMSLVIQVSNNKPFVLIKKDCGNLDLRFMVHRGTAKHLYVGLSCFDRDDKIDIYFFRSNDTKWQTGPGLVSFDKLNRYVSFKYRVDKPKSQVVYTQRLFRVGTVDALDRTNTYSVFYHPKISPPRFYASVGLGVTYYSYQEKLDNLKLTQISITPKINIGFRLIPKVLDLAMNAFGNLVHLHHSPSTFTSGSVQGEELPYARWYGLNGRVGYRLPVGLGATQLYFLSGWYFWGTIVNADREATSYGLKSLSGPQLFFMMVRSQAGHAGFWAYFKFAMIGEKFKVTTLDNREFAFGGGHELSKKESHPFSLTLDIALTQFANDSNSMKLSSATLGLQRPL